MNVHFCEKCVDCLNSTEEILFWKLICMNYITNGECIEFNESFKKDVKCIARLEKLGFLVTTDVQDYICAIPTGIYEVEEEEGFMICTNTELHQNKAGSHQP